MAAGAGSLDSDLLRPAPPKVNFLIQCKRSGQDLPRYIERPVRTGCQRPFYQQDFKLLDLNTGNASGMYAASRIAVGNRIIQHRPVGMSRDQNAPGLICPPGQNLFYFLLFGIVLRRTGRVQEAGCFQGLPDISDQKARRSPQNAVEEIRLMPMGEIDFPGAFCIFQNYARIEVKTRKQFFFLAGAAWIRCTASAREPGIPLYDVVIAVQHDQPVFPVEPG